MAVAIIWEVSPTVQCPQICHYTDPKGPCNLAVPGRITQEGSGEIATASPRLHPKGTSSRFALRAPRPRWGLAMTNLRASRHRMRTAKVASLHGAQRAPLQTQLVHTVFTAACTGRECVAGRGMPLPYSALREAMGKTPLSTLNSRRPAGGYPRTGISSNPGRAPIPRRGSDCSRPDCAPRPPRASARRPAAGSARPTERNTSRFP